jgi:hypothetical protein
MLVLAGCTPKTDTSPVPSVSPTAAAKPKPCDATTPDSTGSKQSNCLTTKDIQKIFGSGYTLTAGYLFYAYQGPNGEPSVHFVLASGDTAQKYWTQEKQRYGDTKAHDTLSTYGTERIICSCSTAKTSKYFAINMLYLGSKYERAIPASVLKDYDAKLGKAAELVRRRFTDRNAT